MIEFETTPGLRLGRRTVRKGSAFPAASESELGEAVPRQLNRGVASSEGRIATERRSHSTVCGGKAAALGLVMGICSLSVLAQTPTPSPSPQDLQVPAIAPDFNPAQKPLPELGRVGVDMSRQKPLTIREALALALENNNVIEVARHNVKIAE